MSRSTPPFAGPASRHGWFLAFGLTLASVLGCGSPAPIELSELRPLPSPALPGLPESGQTLLTEARASFDQQLARAEADPSSIEAEELASAFGELGEHYHAYGLTEAGLAAYANARTLDADEPRWAYLGGVLHQTEGRREQAIADFGRVLELLPEDRPTRLRLAELHMAANEIDRAEASIAPIDETSEDDSAALLFFQGRIAAAREQDARAIEHFEKALELQPAARNLHSLLATLYLRTGDREKAEFHSAEIGGGTVSFDDPRVEAVLGRVVGVGPILDRALDAFGKEAFSEAAAAYLEALELEPENPTALRGAAGSLREAGRLDEALEVLRRFVAAHPDQQIALLELATALIEANQLDEAVTRLEQLAEERPDFQQAHVNLGVALTRAERFEDAEKAFGRALELDPFDQVTRFQLSLAQRGNGDEAAALATLERIIEEAPTFVRARQQLGELLRERGRNAEAAVHFGFVAELEQAASQERALAHYQLGGIASSASRLDAATAHFEAAIELFPELWQAHLALANRYRDADRQLDAAEQFAATVRLQPSLVSARLEEARALARAGRTGRALARLDQGQQELPRAAEIANLRARLLATAEDESLRDGRQALDLASDLMRALPRPEHAESVVMALAAVGDFERAVPMQLQLIEEMSEQASPKERRRLEDNLERYRRRQLARPF